MGSSSKTIDGTSSGLPAWLVDNGPDLDVCVSTRMRIMRNLVGHRFPHHASEMECRDVCAKIIAAHRDSEKANWIRGIGPRDRDDLVARSMISHDFAFERPGRAIWIDDAKRLSVMINEEDHLRIQALTAGWSVEKARTAARGALASFEGLEFAWAPKYGYLSASPYNSGEGVRISAMFHLMALATTKRLLRVLKALEAMNVVVRGLYGESSRAIGAFVQVSVPREDVAALKSAGDVLIQEERTERQLFRIDEVADRTEEAIQATVASRSISLADALRVMGWIRLACCSGVDRFPTNPRQSDIWRTSLDFRTGQDPEVAAKQRAIALRKLVEPLVRPR